MRMNKARPTMSGSLIKYRAYLKYIKYNKNVNNNNNNKKKNNNNNNSNISSSSSSSSSSTNNNKEEEEEIILWYPLEAHLSSCIMKKSINCLIEPLYFKSCN